MKKIATIVEGYGDVASIPALIARTAARLGKPAISLDPPIRSGEAKKLKRAGELERFLLLAASRKDADEIVLVLDLDDDCAAEYSKLFLDRASAIRLPKPVSVCFCLREYEAWFLSDIETLRKSLPEYGIDPKASFPKPALIRGAKGALDRVCLNKGYKPTRDQLLFTRKMDVCKLATSDRSFRKLVKIVTGMGYPEILAVCGELAASGGPSKSEGEEVG